MITHKCKGETRAAAPPVREIHVLHEHTRLSVCIDATCCLLRRCRWCCDETRTAQAVPRTAGGRAYLLSAEHSGGWHSGARAQRRMTHSFQSVRRAVGRGGGVQ
jgi:hypothetical protein